MKSWSLLVIGLGTILSLSCSKGRFSAESPASSTYEIKVVDSGGDATAAPEDPGIETDTKNSGSAESKGSNKDVGECASVAGINKDRVKVSGSENSITMNPQDAIALKVTGDQNLVNLKMNTAAPGVGVSAICIFLAGNQSHVTMDIGITVGKIFIKARGNKALVEAAVSKDGVIENLQVDANGNQPSIVLKGEGRYPCDAAAVSCQNP